MVQTSQKSTFVHADAGLSSFQHSGEVIQAFEQTHQHSGAAIVLLEFDDFGVGEEILKLLPSGEPPGVTMSRTPSMLSLLYMQHVPRRAFLTSIKIQFFKLRETGAILVKS